MRGRFLNQRRTKLCCGLTAVVLLAAVGCSGLGGGLGGFGGLLGGGGGGPAGAIISLLTSIRLPNPLESETQASAAPQAAFGIIMDQPLGRTIIVNAVAVLDSPPGAGALGPDGRLYITERVSGRVRVFDPATMQLLADVILDLAVNSAGHRGLNGACFAPDGSRLFVAYSASTTGADSGAESEGLENRVSSFPFANGAVAGGETVLIRGAIRDASFPSAINTIGRCRIGTDGRLYFSHGDLDSRLMAQDFTAGNLAGKIHRINLDGTIPADNPLGATNSTFCFGLRNPVAFTFDPENGKLWITDNGNVVSDELNTGAAGANYGWPLIQGRADTDAEVVVTGPVPLFFTDPTIDFGQAPISPMGVVALRNHPYGDDLNGNVLIGQAEVQSRVVRWAFDQGLFVFRTELALTAVESGPITDMFVGPNGFVYILTPVHLYRLEPA